MIVLERPGLPLTTYHSPELQVVTQVGDSVDEECVVILKGDRQHGGKEVLCEIMQHFPLPTKLCTQTHKEMMLFRNSEL